MRELRQRHPECQIAYLKVSEGGIYQDPTLVLTVLGSCLGGVFFSRAKKIGAFFHAFLPCQEDWQSVRSATVYTFVDTAITRVLGRFEELGVRPATLEISLVGGASSMMDENHGVGRKNVDAAIQTLARRRLNPGFMDVAGDKGRRVIFISSTGELQVTRLLGTAPHKLDRSKPRGDAAF
ncbi:MAG: chemotaxis protein CheD [Acidobacteriota bacterium]